LSVVRYLLSVVSELKTDFTNNLQLRTFSLEHVQSGNRQRTTAGPRTLDRQFWSIQLIALAPHRGVRGTLGPQ
jgi:hypothetical protein